MEVEGSPAVQLPLIKIEKSTITLEELDNEPGFYQYVIRPMLSRGHEGELCKWLKEMGLIQRSFICTNAENNTACNVPMRWTHARILDKYQWICLCTRKRPIREDSFFNNTKCSLTTCIRILLGWCKDVPSRELMDILSVKSHIISKLYTTCTKIAETYVLSHKNNFRMGGDGSVIIVDVYPDGCAKISGSDVELQNNNPIQILCIAEAKNNPTNYWFHVMNYSEVSMAKMEALKVVETIVKPGSILVADPNSKVCSYSELKQLNKYPTVISIKDLMHHNTSSNTIFQNLATIWEPAVHICEVAQTYGPEEVQSFLSNMIWRRKYAKTPSTALESLLHHITDHYPIES